MHDPTLAEVVLLTVLIVASAGAAWWRFRAILARVRASRPEPGYRVQPIGPRLRRAVREVLFQSKVISQRPLPGLAHALVFWGFCAFALTTLNHVAAGFGFDLIPRESALGRIYFGLVAVFAVAVAVGITGLAVRRFLVRPRWLGKLSPGSGVVALLIFVLMATYLADYAGGHSPAADRALWWTHTFALALFLPIIPKTKHLHLALAPITVFLRREGFSQIPPLAGDEDFGLDTGADITRVTALQAYTCVECGRCTEHCPAANTGKLLDPKQIALGVRSFLNTNGAASPEPLLGEHLAAEAVFQCTTCGACEYQCPVGVQHLSAIIGLRRGAVNTGKWDDDHGAKLFINLERHGNAFGLSSREREKFIQSAGLPIYDGSQDYCLWLGCMGAYDPQGRETVRALARVLGFLGVSFGVLRKEKCTGDAARRLGNDLAFEELATYNLEQLAARKVKRLLSICPHCVRTMSVDWKEYGEAPPIEHHSEFLARHRDRLPEAREGSIVFHDPCYLGRYSDVYDAPRQVLGRYGEPVEADRSRERSFCCGAGGGLVFLGEEKGKRVSVERTEQLTATGAERIAVACPFCHTMFGDALSAGDKNPELADIAQLAAAALPKEPS